MEKTPTASTFTIPNIYRILRHIGRKFFPEFWPKKSPCVLYAKTDSRKQGYHIHKLLWEDAEDFQLTKGSKRKKSNYRKHPKSRPNSFTYVLLNVLGSSLGNIWRFPAAAYLYGGGNFLFAYLVILIFVTKPIFYLEVAMGQFTGKGSGKWWSVCPAFRGIAVGQFIASVGMISYYGVVSSFALLYLIQAFNIKIPWVICKDLPDMDKCFDSNIVKPLGKKGPLYPFSDIFFRENFLKEVSPLEDGIDWPDTGLLIYLLILWLFVGALLYNGVKSIGTMAYVGAILPYLLLLIMAIMTANLPGASDGLEYLFSYDMDELDNAELWYMAAIQAFFSLNASVGVASYLSSQRNFRHRLNRNVCLITLLDVILLILSSSVVFATLGTLGHVTGTKVNETTAYNGGIELTTIIYTDAIPKASTNPEGLAVFFLLMLSIVGVGCCAVIMNSVMSTVWDIMPCITAKLMAPLFTVFGFFLGAVYLTPAGLSILQLVDHYVVGGIMYHMALFEVAAIAYIYGLEKYCKDMTFMTRRKIHIYWRVCLGIITPGILIKILADYYYYSDWKISYRGIKYSDMVLNICFLLQFIGEAMIIIWLIIEIFLFCIRKIMKKGRKFGLVPSPSYGPEDKLIAKDWKRFKDGLKFCSWKEMEYLPEMVLYPIKVLTGLLRDDVFR